MTNYILPEFENKVFSTGDASCDDLIEILQVAMRAGPDLSSLVSPDDNQSVMVRATRLASAVGTLFIRPSVLLKDREFLRLMVLSQTIKNIFLASGFQGADHLLRMMGVHGQNELQKSAQQQRQVFLKALVILGIDSEIEIDYQWLITTEKKLGSIVYLCLLSSKPITSEIGHRRRESLLGMSDRLHAFIPKTTDYLVILSNAWMQCSYADQKNKHKIKSVLNAYLRDWLFEIGCKDSEINGPRVISARPRMLVAAEVMHSTHVQYRYFGQYIRQLRNKFRLILVTEKNQVDGYVRELFDEVLTFERKSDPGYLIEVRDLMASSKPDMVFWPSVGMRHWGTALANLRLAPIQFTALGHSASTFSTQIDYYVAEEGYVKGAEYFGEKVLKIKDSSLRFERSPHIDDEYRPTGRQKSNEVVTVALPSNLLKLNPRYIQTLRRIVAKVGRAVAFKVFPNVGGVELMTTRRVLQEALPNVTVFDVLPYNAYLNLLGQCDLNLSPFPFGGLHSVVDSIRLGVPVIALEGEEPHSRTDAMIIRRLGMPEWLITHSVEEYETIAFRIITDRDLLLQLQTAASSIDVDKEIFGDGTTRMGDEFERAVSWIYKNHEAAQSVDKRVFSEADWRDVSGITT